MLFKVFLAVSFASLVAASSGDRSSDFQGCIRTCDESICHAPGGAPALPITLQLTQWTCLDDCKYQCMHALTDRAEEAIIWGDKHARIHQFYGKWPFWRLLGMQEPASVLFSLLNMWAHLRGMRSLKQRIPNDHPMKKYYLGWSVVNVNAWVWSSVFHTRDKPTTEKLDYFSAALAIVYSLFYTIVRLFHLYTPTKTRLVLSSSRASPFRHRLLKPWAAFCALIFILHVSYLTLLPRFDYTYNMAASVIVGILHNIFWVLYSLPSPPYHLFPSRVPSFRPKCAWKPAAFALLTTAATCLELFDFPPWGRIIDAHALWHLSTPMIVVLWYGFLIDDSLEEGWRGVKA